MTENGGVRIREREDADLPELLEVLRLVHAVDGYPIHWPDDPVAFLTSPRERRAWTAIVERPSGTQIIGHVALKAAEGDPAIGVSSKATGLPADRLAVVARAFVLPSHRRRGVGSALVTTAVESARADGRRAVLDVLESDRPAMALYERLGWLRIGWVMLRSRQGEPLPSYVYASQEPSCPLTVDSVHGRERPPTQADSRCS